EENLRLNADVARLNSALKAQVVPSVAATVPVPAASRALPQPLPALVMINQQRAMLNNLRMVYAAVDQFQLEYKRAPVSLDELVGPTKYIRELHAVARES